MLTTYINKMKNLPKCKAKVDPNAIKYAENCRK